MKFDFLKFQSLVYTFAPLLLRTIDGGEKIVPYIPQIVELVREAEQLPQADGPAKKLFVLSALKTSLEITNKTSKVQVDVEAVLQIVDNGLDALIGTINLVGRPPAVERRKATL